MKKKLLILTLFVLFLSCDKEGLINNTSRTMAINGVVSLQDGVKVRITQTFPAEGTYYDKDTKWNVESAEVELFEDGNKLFNLTYRNNGLYTAPDISWRPTLNKKYSIKAKAKDLPTIESEAVIIPEFDSDIKYTYKYKPNGSTINSGNPYIDINMIIKDDKKPNNAYYVVVDGQKNGKKDNILQVLDASLDAVTYNQMVACGIFPITNHDFCFKNTCLQTQNYQYNFGLELFYSNPTNGAREKADNVAIEISKVSDSWYNYLYKVHNNVELDWQFREPYVNYSNIKGGIGVFYAQNKHSFTIKL